MYENDELLYTQEDMDEWMRTCENLQEHLKEQEEEIEYLEELCDKERLKAIELQQQIREEKTVFDMYRANTIQKGIADPEATKIIRKEVCDEIRNAFKKQFRDGMCGGRFEQVVPIDCFNSILDQIEKGSDNE